MKLARTENSAPVSVERNRLTHHGFVLSQYRKASYTLSPKSGAKSRQRLTTAFHAVDKLKKACGSDFARYTETTRKAIK